MRATSSLYFFRSARFSTAASASRERGVWSPIPFIASRNNSRSSALSITAARAPIISTPYFLSTPERSRLSAVLSAVCPPMVGSSASGRSFSMILATKSGVIGST
jgi:hypothetical protein